MRKLIFATNNIHKVEELRHELGNDLQVVSLREAGIFVDIPEPHDTIEANASEKSRTIQTLTGQDCFSEDTGLEVYSLNGKPGVKSARYVEYDEHYLDNVDKLLDKLKDEDDRRARFKTVISLRLNDREYLFEGICKGKIAHYKKGVGGFGYDPVFLPDGCDKTFGEMSMEEKAEFSHRAKAVNQLAEFLSQHK